MVIRLSSEYARAMNVLVQERQPDCLRDLTRGYAIDFSQENPGEVTLKALAGQDIEDALASLRDDCYRVEKTGPQTATIYL